MSFRATTLDSCDLEQGVTSGRFGPRGARRHTSPWAPLCYCSRTESHAATTTGRGTGRRIFRARLASLDRIKRSTNWQERSMPVQPPRFGRTRGARQLSSKRGLQVGRCNSWGTQCPDSAGQRQRAARSGDCRRRVPCRIARNRSRWRLPQSLQPHWPSLGLHCCARGSRLRRPFEGSQPCVPPRPPAPSSQMNDRSTLQCIQAVDGARRRHHHHGKSGVCEQRQGRKEGGGALRTLTGGRSFVTSRTPNVADFDDVRSARIAARE